MELNNRYIHMLTSYEIFRKLPGIWAFSRTLVNFQEPQSSGTVTGLAEFRAVPGVQDLLHYFEKGTFVTEAGAKFPIQREYFFEFNEKNRNIEKYYATDGAKGGLLYALSANLTGEHLCGEDTYKANYQFPSDDSKEFTLTYEVTGPIKNYTSKTRYTCT